MEYLILDLWDLANSDIKYRINMFPDGQQSITLIEPEKLYKKVHVIVVMSICDFSDWELVLSAVSALRGYTLDYSFYAPYVLGARSDRKFENGGDFYFNDVSKKLLLNLNCPIYIHDLHCKSEFNILHPFSYSDFEKVINNDLTNYTFVFPDESAYRRCLERTLFLDMEFCIFKKERIDGEVIQRHASVKSQITMLENNDFIIFDDLFDGGASFVELCRRMRNQHNVTGEIIIFVTHFIGSSLANLQELAELDIKIITTNSYDCSEEALEYVTQINVFNKDYILDVCNFTLIDL